MALSCKPSSVSFILGLIFLSGAAKIAGGVTVDLIHPDSPLSPLYNASETPYDPARKSLARSLARYSYLKSVLSGEPRKAFKALVTQSTGAYLIQFGIGTPPVKLWAVADTGSDVTWTQCEPCKRCFKPDAPIFDPRKSSTYENLLCSSPQCRALGRQAAPCSNNTCAYHVSYGDGSSSYGSLAIETFTFESSASKDTIRFPKVAFGCGFDNHGGFCWKMPLCCMKMPRCCIKIS